MLEEFAVDGLVEYGSEPVDPSLERPNPEHRAITREIGGLKVKILRLQGRRCELISDVDAQTEDPAGFERFVPARKDAKTLHRQIRKLGAVAPGTRLRLVLDCATEQASDVSS